MDNIVHGWNLFCDGVSKHLVVQTAQLPTLDERVEAFTPGGGHMGYEVPMPSIEPLQLSFTLVNRDPELLALFGLGLGEKRKYTLCENLIDEFTGDETQRVVSAHGRLSTVAPAENRNPALIGTVYTIKSISIYTDTFAGNLVNAFYLRTNRRIVRGVEVTARRNRNLGI